LSEKTLEVSIFRYDPDSGEPPRFKTYGMPAKKGESVLDLLMEIQERRDPTLSFEYSCRSGVCGCCAVRINGVPRLACKTQLSEFKGGRLRIEPLRNMPVLKDLIVDRTNFWRKYEQVKPWLSPQDPFRDKEFLQTPAQLEQIEPYDACRLCGICFSECPTVSRREDFLGPTALAQNLRFILDNRADEPEERLHRVNSNRGAWGCNAIFRCARFCPRGISPALAIMTTRRKELGRFIAAFRPFKRRATEG